MLLYSLRAKLQKSRRLKIIASISSIVGWTFLIKSGPAKVVVQFRTRRIVCLAARQTSGRNRRCYRFRRGFHATQRSVNSSERGEQRELSPALWLARYGKYRGQRTQCSPELGSVVKGPNKALLETRIHMDDYGCQLNRSMQHRPVHRFGNASAGDPFIWVCTIKT
jgi:hypothetical protein